MPARGQTKRENRRSHGRASGESIVDQNDRLMTHVAMQQADDAGNVVTWGEHVSDDDYTQEPS